MIHWAPGMKLEHVERQIFLQALQFHAGNKMKTARALGVCIRTVRNRIRDCDELAQYREDARYRPHSGIRMTQG